MPGRAFGLLLETTFDLPGLVQNAAPEKGPAVRLELASPADAERAWESPLSSVEVWKTRFPSGEIVTVAEREDGAQRIAFGSAATFVLAPGAGHILCAPDDLDDVRWRRFLLDTVLWWTSASRGFFLLHACALQGPMGTVAFASVTGGGKTTLALELLRRGWTLVADDVVALEARDGRIEAHCAPGLMNAPASVVDLAALGTPLAEIDDEVWLEVEQAGGSEPLDAVVLYARGEEHDLRLERQRHSVLDLVPHIWDVRGDPDRLRERFNFLADIVDSTPIFDLYAHAASPPGEIAGLVESTLARLPQQ